MVLGRARKASAAAGILVVLACVASGCGLPGAASAGEDSALGLAADPVTGNPAARAEASPSPGGPQAGPYLGWANRLAARTRIPARALAAYAAADAALAEEQPSCRLNWATLAGIGGVESAHGTLHHARLDADGVARPRIIGPRLDGTSSFGRVADTDHGRLDRDPTWDHAIGPMQFTPGSWRRWAADGDGDGETDPQDIDDAALTAGRYLCASGLDLTTAEGWWRAVKSYNHSTEYVHDVYTATVAYAARSKRIR